jgi:predicted permease
MVRRFRRLLARVRAFVSTRADDRDFEEELTAHLDLLTEDHIRRGMPPAEARRAARIALGSVTSLKEQHRDVRGLPSVSTVLADIVFATRLFRREPLLFLLTIAGLALAIGISTAVFSLLNVLAFRGYGVTASRNVVQLLPLDANRPGSPWMYRDYEQLREMLPAAQLTASVGTGIVALPFGTPEDGVPLEFLETTAVSGNYFTLLGGRPVIGRTLIESDDIAGAPRVVVMGELFWRTRFASDPSIVGRTMHFGGVPFTVAGVIHRAFTGPRIIPTAPAFWMPVTTFFEIRESNQAAKFNRAFVYYDVYARLGPTMPAALVEARARSIAVARAAAFPQPGAASRAGLRLAKLGEIRSTSGQRFVIAIVLITLGLVLVVGCANVANVLLASAAGRRKEIGTRLALGASHGRVVRQLMTESVLLGLMAAAGGLLIAVWLGPWLIAQQQDPGLVDMSLDPIVYLFAVFAGMVSGVVAGAAPARYGRRGDLVSALNTDRYGASTAVPPSRMRSVFLGSQAAAAMILLVIMTLMARSFIHASTLNPGLDPDRLLNVSGLGNRYNAATATAYWDAAIPELRQAPGFTGAALALKPPFSGGYIPQNVAGATGVGVSGYLMGASTHVVYRNEVSPEYFDTVGVHVLRGRTYTVEEARTEAPVAVISNCLAQIFWKGEDPIGSSLQRVWGEEDRPGARLTGPRKPTGTRIIGVVSDVISTFHAEDSATLYLPLRPADMMNARLVVSVDGNASALSRQVRDILRSMDPQLRPTVRLVTDLRASELSEQRGTALLSALLGGAALTLAVIGLFGVTAFVVRQRRHEISVRMALGASGWQIVGLLLRDTLRPVAIGIAMGLGLAVLAGHVIRGALYGISGHDPIALVAAVAVLIVAVTAAALGPALRALHVDPAEMLKQ